MSKPYFNDIKYGYNRIPVPQNTVTTVFQCHKIRLQPYSSATKYRQNTVSFFQIQIFFQFFFSFFWNFFLEFFFGIFFGNFFGNFFLEFFLGIFFWNFFLEFFWNFFLCLKLKYTLGLLKDL
jgi:hypothetical protein